jgi:hypothetical protein
MLHDAPWLCIAHLPAEVKMQVADYLNTQSFSAEYVEEIQKIIEFMRLGVSYNGVDLINNIQKLDHRRNESLKTVAPKLAEILNYD